ncbi:restriction endonuclease subunit S [Luteolibacter flavescens]|uniref:Restriction endonuclease subunit S n=1 Tax=Luteolibacter flavescens TaxID=1859460 RepID=A0ABT3FI18_9BACT|nr:restriction endonuclease subunit S [Luteolibacter flavescens]MCW1883102.1 restriction endonuclease subunit S [Luteolibacter flavescens]
MKTPANGEARRLIVHAESDTILISRSNTPALVGASAYVGDDFPLSFLPDTLWLLRPKDRDSVSMRWLAYVIGSDDCRRLLQSIASGTSQSMKKIQKGSFLRLVALTPPLTEQRKIADILSTWDEALERLDALIAAKDRRKQALMQQLLTGKKRVKGANGKWKVATLGDLLTPISRTVPKPTGSFLAAGIRSHGKGVFLKPDFKPEGIALDELFELKAGDLVVNITFAWEGAAAIVPDVADGALVSHRFPTFLFKDGLASRSFFRHYIRSKRFVFDCGLASPGGAGRNRVLSKTAFLNIELKVPSFEEQEQIGSLLDTADQELALLRRQRDALDQQKRGLMQRLLTGKIRVTPEAE